MAEQVTIAGIELKCVICGNNTFNKTNIKLNSTGALLWGGGILAQGGKAYICDKCGFSHDFYK